MSFLSNLFLWSKLGQSQTFSNQHKVHEVPASGQQTVRLKTSLKSQDDTFTVKSFRFICLFQTFRRAADRPLAAVRDLLVAYECPGLGIWTLVNLNTLHVWCLIVVVFWESLSFRINSRQSYFISQHGYTYITSCTILKKCCSGLFQHCFGFLDFSRWF